MSTAKTWVLLDGITKIQSQPLPTEQLQLAILKMNERDWTRFYVWTAGWANWQLLKDFLNSEQRDFALPGAPVSEQNVKAHIQAQIQNKNRNQQAQAQQRPAPLPQQAEDTVTKAAEWQANNKALTTVSAEDTYSEVANHMQKDFNGDHLDIEKAHHKPPDPLNFKEISEAYKNRAERHELKIEILLISQKGKTFKSYSKNISLSGTLLEDNIPFDFYGVPFDLIVVNRNPSTPQNGRVQVRAQTVGDGLTQRTRFINVTEMQKQKLANLLNDYLNQQTKVRKTS